MNKNLLLTIVVVLLAVSGILFLAYITASKNNVLLSQGIVLFYGQGCSHCKNVDDFISQNKIEDKVKFTRLEVWYNKNNQNILAQAAQKCGIQTGQVGVPFLYDGGGKCYVGDVDTINFFKQQAGIN